MTSLLSIHRSPDRCETGRGFSGKRLIAGSSEKSLSRPLPLANLQPRSSGVLERSDRTTDCFMRGATAYNTRMVVNTLLLSLGRFAESVGLCFALRVRPPFNKAVCELKPRQIQGRTYRPSVDLGPCKARQEKASTDLGDPTREGLEMYL